MACVAFVPFAFACGSAESTFGANADPDGPGASGNDSDAGGVATSDASSDAGNGNPDGGGTSELPAEVSKDFDGDAVVPAGEKVRITYPGSKLITINGNLEVGAGATIELSAGLGVTGTLTLRPGARIEGAPGSSVSWYVKPAKLVVEGTAEEPVSFSGGLGLTIETSTCDVRYGDFGPSVSFRCAGGRAIVRDSWFRSFTGIGGDGITTSFVEHCSFQGAGLSLGKATLRASELAKATLVLAREPGSANWNQIACEGNHDDPQDVAVSGNAFTGYADLSTLISIDRDYAAISLQGNYFDGATTNDLFDFWNGTNTTGCGDGIGSYGGPLTVTPKLNARPAGIGPR
jgi:hypothetical protein